jgi:hypothetical protein
MKHSRRNSNLPEELEDVESTQDERLPKLVFKYKTLGKQNRGHPKK